MKRFAYDIIIIVIASIIVNMILAWWSNSVVTSTADSTYVAPHNLPMAAASLPTNTPIAKPTPVPTPSPVPTISSAQVIYVFNLQPIRVWFNKEDAVGYRNAILDGEPTRPFISIEKSRTVRGGRMIVLKQEDGLVMVKAEDTDIVGWIQ